MIIALLQSYYHTHTAVLNLFARRVDNSGVHVEREKQFFSINMPTTADAGEPQTYTKSDTQNVMMQ